MAETEPTPWELMRFMKGMDGKLDQVVTKDMFQAESRRVDERLDEQGRDIADERTARAEAIGAERATREKEVASVRDEIDKSKSNMRWLAASIALPIGLFLFDKFGGGS